MTRVFGEFMKAITLFGLALIVALGLSQAPPAGKTPQRDYPVKPVPFTAVHVNDVFWAPRIEINRTVTIPFADADAAARQVTGSDNTANYSDHRAIRSFVEY